MQERIKARLGITPIQTQNSAKPDDPTERNSTIQDDNPKFGNLRRITRSMTNKTLVKQPSAIVDKYPRLNHIYQRFKAIQKLLYLVLEDPSTSLLAKIVFAMIMTAILFSTVNTIVSNALGTNDAVEHVETAISIMFLVEYALRLLSATAFGDSFFAVICKPFNLLDICGIIPYFAELVLDRLNAELQMISVLRLVRLVKIIRVFKLGRYLKGAEVFYQGMKASVGSFGFLMLLIAMLDITGATLLYYAESQPLSIDNFNENTATGVTNLPEAMWFSLVTIATVGYGDYEPKTLLGKLITIVLAVVGMLIISLPVAILGNNFSTTYVQQLEDENIRTLKESKLSTQASLNDSQKEIFFMNERIHQIENTNRTIIKLLHESEANYNQVAKKLKNLYESIFADEETIAKKEKRRQGIDFSNSPLLGSKIETRIKVYEKLNRAKRKINLAVLFKGPSGISAVSTENNQDETGADVAVVDAGNKPLASGKQKSFKNLLAMNRQKTRFGLAAARNDSVASDIVETEGGAFPNSVFSMENKIKINKPNQYLDKYRGYRSRHAVEGEDPLKADTVKKHTEERAQPRILIKSHSVDNSNEFLAYYVRNLSFLTPKLLQELIGDKDSDSSNEVGDSEDDTINSPLLTKGKANTRIHRRNSVTGVRKPDENPQEKQQKKNKKARVIDMTKAGKFVPKNYDRKIWELSGKILENMEQKAILGTTLVGLDKTVAEQSKEVREIEKAIDSAKDEIQRLMKLKEQVIEHNKIEINFQHTLQVITEMNRESPIHREQKKQRIPSIDDGFAKASEDFKQIDLFTGNRNIPLQNKGNETSRLQDEYSVIKEEDESFVNSGRSTPVPMLRKYPPPLSSWRKGND